VVTGRKPIISSDPMIPIDPASVLEVREDEKR
jgi:hypothetical protein